MKHSVTLAVIAILLSAALAFAEDDAAMKKSDLPEAVLKAFEASNPDALATEYGKKDVNGQIRYEIETKVGDLEKDFVYLPDGTLLQVDEDVPVELLPDAIVESVKKAYPEGEIDEADKITRGDTIDYELIVEVGETDYELLVSADGKIISSVQAGEDEDEPGDVDEGDEEDGD